jgi:hypothetical protein
MREVLGDRLPQITEDEWKVVRASSDFYGMNTYTTNLCREFSILRNSDHMLQVELTCRQRRWG